jgi:hypothetical protein
VKKLFAVYKANTQKHLIEQAEKTRCGNRRGETNKQTNMETQNLLTMKTMPAQPVKDHIASTHFTAITKPSEILFDGKPENWQEFEHHLLKKAENPTIRWNQELLNFNYWTQQHNHLTSWKVTSTSLKP